MSCKTVISNHHAPKGWSRSGLITLRHISSSSSTVYCWLDANWCIQPGFCPGLSPMSWDGAGPSGNRARLKRRLRSNRAQLHINCSVRIDFFKIFFKHWIYSRKPRLKHEIMLFDSYPPCSEDPWIAMSMKVENTPKKSFSFFFPSPHRRVST